MKWVRRQESVNEIVREKDKSDEGEYQLASSILGTPSWIQSSSLRAASIMDGPSSVSNPFCLLKGGGYNFHDYAYT